MNTLADSGISSALSAIGGRIWQDPDEFGKLINTAMALRRYLTVIATVVVIPILFVMLVRSGASVNYTLILILSILVELYFYINIGVLITIPRLTSMISTLQGLSFLSAISRALLLIGGTFSGLNAIIAILASTISSGLQNFMIFQSTKKTINLQSKPDKKYKIEIFNVVKTQAPNTVFYCIQGQITILLISIFGNTQNIAEAGALGRISIVFTLISSVMTDIVLPIFSRTQSYDLLVRKYKQIISAYVFLSFIILLITIAFPAQLLMILGKNYVLLNKELFFFMLSAIIHSISGILWAINASKGWTKQAWMFIPTIIITQIVLLFFIDVSNIIGVSMFSALSVIPASCINFYMTYRGLMTAKSMAIQA